MLTSHIVFYCRLSHKKTTDIQLESTRYGFYFSILNIQWNFNISTTYLYCFCSYFSGSKRKYKYTAFTVLYHHIDIKKKIFLALSRSVAVSIEDYKAYFRKQKADSNCGFAEEFEVKL